MELKLLSENKLKIILTDDDLASMDITCEEINYDDTGTRRVIWDLLDKAKRQTGFDAAQDRLYLQVFPDKSGGCLMYVTKLEAPRGEASGAISFIQGEAACKAPRGESAAGAAPKECVKTDGSVYEKKFRSKLYTAAKKKRLVYAFPDSEILALACRQLAALGYSGRSDIFAGEDCYYLYIEDTKEPCAEVACEYGEPVNNPYFAYYLHEYTKKLVADNGINVFAEMFM